MAKTKRGRPKKVTEAPVKVVSKAQAIDLAVKQLEQQFGKGSVMRLDDKAKIEPIEVISTGSIGLDRALGVGGYPKGRVVEIFGPEASGKTTMTLHAIAEAQKQGSLAAFIDVEHSLDPAYARAIGVDLGALLVSQPNTGEQALEMVDALVRSGCVSIIVVDSVAALVPKAEIEGEMGDQQMGLQARLMSKAMRKLVGNMSKSNTCVIFVNQIRMKIGVMFGSPETTSGGRALKFYATIRLDIRRTGAVKDGDDHTGNKTKVKVVKNKVAPPFKIAEFDIVYGKGVSWASELVDIGVLEGIVEKAGVWYSYEGTRLGQGKENAAQYLRDNPKVATKIKKQIMA